MYHPNLESVQNSLNEACLDPEILSFFLFCGSEQNDSVEELNQVLTSSSKPIIGGIFPGIIADGQQYSSGYCLVSLDLDLQIKIYQGSDDSDILHDKIATDATGLANYAETIFCFADALWGSKDHFFSYLYECYGPFVNYVGGGAGNLHFESHPCIFSNQGVLKDAAVIGVTKREIEVGVAHGWKPISEAFKVTKVEGNNLITLNHKEAFKVYQEAIVKHQGAEITENHFFDIAKSYPFGMVNIDAEMVVRDPISTKEGVLQIVDSIPEGVYVRIMYGDLDTLLREGSLAALQTATKTRSDEGSYKLCIDCISRVLYMKEHFHRELEIINTGYKAFGALTLGEFANPGKVKLQIYNKTCVIAIWTKAN